MIRNKNIKSINPREGWTRKIKKLIAEDGDPTAGFDDMLIAANDGLEDLPWDGPTYKEWLKSNLKLS